MANRFLGETLDIHGGGKDLIFPHHENEIAQSEALLEKPFSLYWMHHGLLTIGGRKMSKSLGNFITLKEAVAKHSAEVIKIAYLSTHYRSPLDFSEEKLKECKRVKERIGVFIKQLESRTETQIGSNCENIPRRFSYKEFDGLYAKFIEAMDDDFNTSLGFSVVFDIVKVINENLDKTKQFFLEAQNLLKIILCIFSIEKLACYPTVEDINLSLPSDEEINNKIALRASLRKQGKFKEADAIRSELLSKGIVLEDQPTGKTIWYRK